MSLLNTTRRAFGEQFEPKRLQICGLVVSVPDAQAGLADEVPALPHRYSQHRRGSGGAGGQAVGGLQALQ